MDEQHGADHVGGGHDPAGADPTTWKGVVVRLVGDQECRTDLLGVLPMVMVFAATVVVALVVAIILIVLHAPMGTSVGVGLGGGVVVGGSTAWSAIRRRRRCTVA